MHLTAVVKINTEFKKKSFDTAFVISENDAYEFWYYSRI
jgi:hypothetical protein